MILPSFWAKVLFTALIAPTFSVCANSFSTNFTDGLLYQSENGNVRIKVGGRLHLDGAVFNEDKMRLKNDWMVRRARLSLRGELFKNWHLRVQYNLLDTEKRYRSLWLRYSGFENTYITAGQFGNPFGMEKGTSSNSLVFMERSLANALVLDSSVGFGVQRWRNNWGMAAGIFWESYIEEADLLAEKKGYGFSGRFTTAPITQKNRTLHLGASVSYGIPGEGDRLRIRSRPESAVIDTRFVSTGRMRNVNSHLSAGLEAALVLGSISLQGEYIQTQVFRYGDQENEIFDGGYVYISWLVRGYQRRYSSRSGAFSKVRPKKGSEWEVAVRYSFLDLNSRTGTVSGGQQVNTAWALNGYLNKNVRLMFNYIQVNADTEAGRETPTILQMRLQWVI